MRFASSSDEGSGVVVFETERIFGGDAQYYYLGDYKIKGTKIEANVKARHYSGEPYSIFGYRTKFTVQLRGQLEGSDVMTCQGHLQGEPGNQLGIVLRKLADLP
jgi:hypothetical protein